MSSKKDTASFSDKTKKRLYLLFWLGGLSPFIIITLLLLFQSEDDLPSVEMLDNPPEMLASIVSLRENIRHCTRGRPRWSSSVRTTTRSTAG